MGPGPVGRTVSQEPEGRGDSLAARLESVIGWVETHVDGFDPFLGDEPYRATRGQRASELAVALYVHSALLPDRRARVAGLVDFLHELRQRPEFLHRILRNPAEFVLVADLYGLLRLVERDDLAHRTLVQRAIDAGFLDHVERPPHRELDVRLALEWCGVEHPWASMQEVISRSPLVQGPLSPLFLDESALYALTHIVMFGTDFGLANGAHCTPNTLVDVGRVIPQLTLIACADRHWDLLGEFLICHDALDLPRDAAWQEAWSAFLDQQLPDGSFPGPESAQELPETLEKMTGEERDKATFAHHYHTTLIGWIALAGRVGAKDGRASHSEAAGDSRTEPQGQHASRDDSSPERERTARWIEGVVEDLERDGPTLGEACAVVIGLELCGHRRDGTAVDRQVLKRAVRLIDTVADVEEESGHDRASAPIGVDVPTRLIAAAVVLTGGLDLPAALGLLPSLVSLLRDEDRGSSPQRDDTFVQEARGVVAALGLCAPPASFSEEALQRELATPLITRDREAQFELIRRIETTTCWGQRPLQDPAGVEPVVPILQALATAALRQLDMDLGCRMLRAIQMLAPATDTRLWREYLLVQSRPDGAFGFFGPEARSFRLSDPPGTTPLRRLELATTVTCLWTLEELSQPGWSLPSCLGDNE